MTYPSPEQFALDLTTLYYAKYTSALREDILQRLVYSFQGALENAQPSIKPNESYHVFLEACLKGLSAFHEAAPLIAFQENEPALFSQTVDVDLQNASNEMGRPLSEFTEKLLSLGMFQRTTLYNHYSAAFDEFEPEFDLRSPVDADAYERRDYREAKERFAKEHKAWAARKREFEKQKANYEKELSLAGRLFEGTILNRNYFRLPGVETLTVPIVIDEPSRMQHLWIVADSGHGKTQLFQRMVLEDLKQVALGKRSVIVMDSQNRFIPTISKLQFFAPGQPLHDRLTVINPADNDLALNLFDLTFRRHSNERSRQSVINATLQLYSFVFASLLDRPMTGKQRTLFEYAALLLFETPDSTIGTFRDLMRKGALDRHPEIKAAISKFPKGSAVREFFDHDFNGPDYAQTKEEVVGRLMALLRNTTFDRMFSQTLNKLDLFSEMNTGRVILINTAQNLLQPDGVRFFGRLMLALIGSAVAERSEIQDDRQKTPTYVYIDEAFEYIKDDQNFINLLAQARKQNVALSVAQQWLTQLDEPVYDGLAAIANTIIAAGVSISDAYKLGQMMNNTSPDFIRMMPNLSFALFNKKLTPKGATRITIPWGAMETLPTMTATEYQQQLALMRFRLGRDSMDHDLHWEMTISPKLARDGGQTKEHGFNITIPSGLEDGEVLRLKGKGRQKPDGSFGHIYITVHIPKLHQSTESIEPPAAKSRPEPKEKEW